MTHLSLPGDSMSQVRRTIVARGLLAAGLLALSAVRAATDDDAVVPLDPLVVTTPRLPAVALKSYRTQTTELMEQTRQLRTIRYIDVILNSYDTAHLDLPAVLRAKAAYRQAWGDRRVFLSRYDLIERRVPVIWKNEPMMMEGQVSSSVAADALGLDDGGSHSLKTKAGAKYVDLSAPERQQSARRFWKNPPPGVIWVSRQADLPAFIHASGLSLAGTATPEQAARLGWLRDGIIFDTEFRITQRAEFEPVTNTILTQIRFEVQLQDLNRFYAVYRHHPIMDPLQAAEAVAMLGARPDARRVEAILRRNNVAFAPADLQAALNAKRMPGNEFDAFEYAFRLASDLIHNDRKASEQLLEAILLEAPGHL